MLLYSAIMFLVGIPFVGMHIAIYSCLKPKKSHPKDGFSLLYERGYQIRNTLRSYI